MKQTMRFCLSFMLWCNLASPGAAVWYDDASLARMQTLLAPLVDRGPVLTGKLDDSAWKQAAQFTLGTSAAAQTTAAYVLRDADNIYLAFRCAEPQPDRIVVKQAPRDSNQVWPHDRIEIFFAPGTSSDARYQLILNVLGGIYESRNNDLSWNPAWEVKTARGTNNWVAECRIPLADIGIDGKAPFAMHRFSVTRVRQVEGLPEEATSWNLNEGIYGSAERFGTLVFGDMERYVAALNKINLSLYLNRDVYDAADHRLVCWVDTGGAQGVITQSIWTGEVLSGDKVVSAAPLKPAAGGFLFEMDIHALAPGEYFFRVRAETGKETTAEARTAFIKTNANAYPEAEKRTRVRLTMTKPAAADCERWNFVTGVPMPKGALWDARNARLLDARSNEVPAGISGINRWDPGSDSSIRWLRVNFSDPVRKNEQNAYILEVGAEVKAAPSMPALGIDENAQAIRVNTGPLTFQVGRSPFRLQDVRFNGKPVVADTDLVMIDQDNRTFLSSRDTNVAAQVEERDSRRCVIAARGTHRGEDGKPLGFFVLRIEAFAGSPNLRLWHTFIINENTHKVKYRDIAMRFRAPAGDQLPVTIGGAGTLKSGGYLLQRESDAFDAVTRDAEWSGARAEGWLTRGPLFLAVRDFRQNYPQELEALADTVTAHFWPAHGRDNPGRKVNARNLALGWCFHEGRLLDFTLPASYPEIKGTYDPNKEVEGARNSTGAGVGKTHELLISFADAWDSAKAQALNANFQAFLHVLSDPKWNADSGVFGLMTAASETENREIENAMARIIAFWNTTYDRLKYYGMWNYGDTADGSYAGDYINVYRHWKGAHHSEPRPYWPLYARSGNPVFLDAGVRNARHVGDVDTCHVDFNDGGVTKFSGGLYYPSAIHWGQGPYAGFYLESDMLWWQYFLTGEGRGKDVALEQAERVWRNPAHTLHREGAGTTCTAIDALEGTNDPRFILLMRTLAATMLSKPAWIHDPEKGGQHAANWSPWLVRYIDVTRSRKAIEFAVNWSESGTAFIGHPGENDVLAYAAWHAPQNAKVTEALKTRMAEMAQFFELVTRREGHYLDGWPAHESALNWLYFQYPMLLKAAQARAVSADFAPRTGLVDCSGYLGTKRCLTYLQAAQNNAEIKIGGQSWGRCERTFALFNNAGKEIAGLTCTNGGTGKFDWVFPAKPGETFRCQVEAGSSDYSGLPQVENGKQVFKAGDATLGIVGTLFFSVPANAERFSLLLVNGGWMHRGYNQYCTEVVVCGPDGKARRRASVLVNEQVTMDLDAPPATRGKLWSLTTRGVHLIGIAGAPPFIATAPEKFFLPEERGPVPGSK